MTFPVRNLAPGMQELALRLLFKAVEFTEIRRAASARILAYWVTARGRKVSFDVKDALSMVPTVL